MRASQRLIGKLACAACFVWVAAVVWPGRALSDDWPTYRHDIARSGVTTERLDLPLSECWVFQPRHAPQPAWGDPKPEPVEGILELRRVHFDDANQVAVAGGALFFGSSADNKVYCLDAATGQLRWTRLVGGPVRLAPTVWKDRVFVGSDDGFVYCRRAADGAIVWKRRACPSDRKVLGHGRMISLWPLRTGVLVDDGIAYFASGVFPAEGVFLWAVRAQDGQVLWCNGGAGEAPQSRTSPQGYLLATASRLFVPMGRVSPAAFDRRDGRLLSSAYFGKTIGGSYALLADQYVFTGTEAMVAYQQDSPASRFAWFAGRKLLAAKGHFYMLSDREMSALDLKSYAPASRRRHSLLSQKKRVERELIAARKQSKDVSKLQREAKQLDEQIAEAEKTMASSVQWRRSCRNSDSFILAGDLLLAGGQDHVIAVDAATGKLLWTASVQGTAKGLAAAAGRLFVSTDTGAIYCFGGPGSPRHGTVREASGRAPFPPDELTAVYEAAAQRILRATGIRRGYCLVLGCETGRLALELARRSQLRIYAVDPDGEKVAAARQALDAAGLYGTRVCVQQWPLGRVPYSDYFANLIVSERPLVSGRLPEAPGEMFRMLKPLGGTIYLGQPAEAAGRVQPLRPQQLRQWLQASHLAGGEVTEQGGVWLKLTRGPLDGAGRWTHQYAEPGNTACSDDRLVRCPLGVLWFGRPGPNKIVNRHRRAAAPLSVNGRLFIQGENVVMAYDAYNGLKLWQRDIPGAMRVNASHDGSNLAADDDSLLVATGPQCLRLDAATGRTLRTYRLPAAGDGKPRRWGYVAVVGQLLYGSRTERGLVSDAVFAVEVATGKLRWLVDAKRVPHNSIAIGDGRMFLADSSVTRAQRQSALKTSSAQREQRARTARREAASAVQSADVRRVVALDASTGRLIWQQAVDLTHCGGRNLSAIYHDGVLLLFGVYLDGHHWEEFFAGQFRSRRITALSGDDGSLLWSRAIGYRVRPLVIGDTLHAEPWAFDLHTGKQKTRIHPVTGRAEPWQFARPGHHCGCPAASPNLMLFRSYCIGYYDLVGDYGTMHFGGQRTGCWINFLPANGLVMVPEASAGCMCPFPNMCTVVFQPRPENKAWAMFSSPGPLTPVQHLAINLGAPGDRKDRQGNLWLAFPRPKGRLVMPLAAQTELLPGAGYFHRNPDMVTIQGTERPWVLASGCRGLSQCTIPVDAGKNGTARYTVKLAFADPDNERPGVRVFDIVLQEKVVQHAFDLVKEAGGPNKAIVKQFEGILANQKLTIQLRPDVARPTARQMPILQGIEIIRE